jgi:hypothetical protein
MIHAIVAPLCAYTLLVFLIWARLGYVRISGARNGEIPPEYLRVGQGPRPSDAVVDVHHHFSNQFEMPVLFYLGCLLALAAGLVDPAVLTLAWAFVALRVLHTAIVLTGNDPRKRVAPYVLSSFAVWALWIHLFVHLVWNTPSAAA